MELSPKTAGSLAPQELDSIPSILLITSTEVHRDKSVKIPRYLPTPPSESGFTFLPPMPVASQSPGPNHQTRGNWSFDAGLGIIGLGQTAGQFSSIRKQRVELQGSDRRTLDTKKTAKIGGYKFENPVRFSSLSSLPFGRPLSEVDDEEEFGAGSPLVSFQSSSGWGEKFSGGTSADEKKGIEKEEEDWQDAIVEGFGTKILIC